MDKPTITKPMFACLEALDQAALNNAPDERAAVALIEQVLLVSLEVLLQMEPAFAEQANDRLEAIGWHLVRTTH
jgi:hypothetical protein